MIKPLFSLNLNPHSYFESHEFADCAEEENIELGCILAIIPNTEFPHAVRMTTLM
jgi:hypothetical protein